MLRGEDDKRAEGTTLKSAFGDATLRDLRGALVAATPNAAAAVDQLLAAAERLQTRETQFNSRARKSAGPDLKTHLRPAEHFAALKSFQTAKQHLLGFGEAVAPRLIELLEDRISTQALKPATPKA